ncbi:hypothetical protein BH582_14300 [Vibrio sp. 10N.222.47.A9]|uniref:hypothetical protein n=1 Tax=Vibrio sp. 10N.222.47.A9 TaxID=1903178 RepID=UPI0009766FDA|nr:hypothetical protein [Vibrio sp. 10N.222.47.A9]OMO31300.1 hypothetical protein BH582_14300 [Vibrio sp. 10N.222.47.A9]
MQSINITADDIDMISQAFAIYGFIGVLGALFFYDLLSWFALASVRRFRAFYRKYQLIKVSTDISERRARAKVS